MKEEPNNKKDYWKDYLDITKNYIQDICDFLNNSGVKYRYYYYYENSREEDYSHVFFYSLYHFLSEIRKHHSLLENQGLLNRGFCPYTGEEIVDNAFQGVISKTVIFFSKEGLDAFIQEEKDTRKGEGCYIATACYGGINSPEVVELRFFRDQVLKSYFLGRYFIRVYYLFSPKVASYLKTKKYLNYFVRKLILDPFVLLIKGFFQKQ